MTTEAVQETQEAQQTEDPQVDFADIFFNKNPINKEVEQEEAAGETEEETTLQTEGELPAESKENEEEGKQKFHLKIRGEENDEYLTPDEIHARVQKGTDYDRLMSKYDLDKRALEKKVEELSTQRTQNSDAGIFEEIRQKDPELHSRLFKTMDDYRRELNQPEVSPVDEEISKLKDLMADPAIREVPAFTQIASAIENLYGEVVELRQDKANGSAGIKDDVEQLKKYKEGIEKKQADDYINYNMKIFKEFAQEHNINYSLDGNDDNIGDIATLVAGGKPILEAARKIYGIANSQKASTEQEKKPEAQTRERKPLEVKPKPEAGPVNKRTEEKRMLVNAFFTPKRGSI